MKLQYEFRDRKTWFRKPVQFQEGEISFRKKNNMDKTSSPVTRD